MKIFLILTICLGLFGVKLSTDPAQEYLSTKCLWGSIIANVLGMLYMIGLVLF